MNNTYRVVLSDDEQKMLAVVLKKERLRDLQDFCRGYLENGFLIVERAWICLCCLLEFLELNLS